MAERQSDGPAGAWGIGQRREVAAGQEGLEMFAHGLGMAVKGAGNLRDGVAEVRQADHLQALAHLGSQGARAGEVIQFGTLVRGQGDPDDLGHSRWYLPAIYYTIYLPEAD